MITVSRQKGPMMPGGASSAAFLWTFSPMRMTSGSRDSRSTIGKLPTTVYVGANVDFELYLCGDFADAVHCGLVSAVHREKFYVVI